jgi:hypothetical protein
VTLADLNVGALNSTYQALVYGSDTVSTVIDPGAHKASMLHNGTAYMSVDNLNAVTIPKLTGTTLYIYINSTKSAIRKQKRIIAMRVII